MNTCVVGIDPGKTGYLAAIILPDKIISVLPTDSQPLQIVEWLNRMDSKAQIQMVVMEQVHSIFGASAKSNFKFGFNVGFITGIVQSKGLGMTYIQPKAWQGILRIPKTEKENRKKIHAETMLQLYPHSRDLIYTPRGRLLDGAADAILIAHAALVSGAALISNK